MLSTAMRTERGWVPGRGTLLEPFRISISHAATRIEVGGDVDVSTAAILIGTANASDPRRDLTIDLTAVDFIDAAGLNALVGIHHELRSAGRSLSVVGASPRIARTFLLGRADWLLADDVLARLASAIIAAARPAQDHPEDSSGALLTPGAA